MRDQDRIESAWDTIWKDLIEHPDGTLDKEALKKELHDYAVLFQSVQLAYSTLTGGEVSHPFTRLDVLLSYVDMYNEEMKILQEDVKNTKQKEVFKEERDGIFDIPYSKATIH